MNPDKQRKRIAEACGWWRIGEGGKWGGFPPNCAPIWENICDVPDYLNDLNAMQSAVNYQSIDFQEEFDTALRSLNVFIHQTTSTQWAEIFIDAALRKGIIKR